MTTVQSHKTPVVAGQPDVTISHDQNTVHPAVRYVWGGLRIVMGVTFLWAFLDKLLALGYSTGVDSTTGAVDRFGPAAWIHGGSPTDGFLAFGAKGPFEGFYHAIAGTAFADIMFMAALLGLGVAFLSGTFMRIATVAGALLYLMMWSVVLPTANNPLFDDHTIGFFVVILLGLYGTGRYLGLGNWWAKQTIVQRFPILK
ncbi:MAG: thiosulfate dehydrogenase (quinone) large subunit [Nocardioidaceae bacterium]|jgi:thiosulfate dehydrogenase [quinone] large subunit|nr:thiosulfate dehydrogenase (quinone) large subunit [Nocardioidaceae bacterium]MDX6309400.1 thiosulfate dehydrogenase (quinone) large subunit [Nocardioidaceae bacterium]